MSASNARVTPTLAAYMARRYIINALMLLGLLLVLVYFFDTIELLRRASKRPDIPLSLVLEMGLLKLPDVGQILIPFVVLFSAMFTFWQLSRQHELTVMRASGFSAWQFLAPILAVAFGFGVLQMTIINPVGAFLLTRYAQLEQTKLSAENSPVALLREGLWLRQPLETGYVIIHVRSFAPEDWSLHDVMLLGFNHEDLLLQRIDAPRGRLEPGQWLLDDAMLHDVRKQGVPRLGARKTLAVPTNLSLQDLENGFAAPGTIPFWALPDHIRTMRETGFEASRLMVHLHALLAQPVMLMAMILLAAAVSFGPPRAHETLVITLSGIAAGFIVFFLSSYLQALGGSGELPPALAAWAPSLISFLCGLSALMVLEDG